jgi:hypothetical protein
VAATADGRGPLSSPLLESKDGVRMQKGSVSSWSSTWFRVATPEGWLRRTAAARIVWRASAVIMAASTHLPRTSPMTTHLSSGLISNTS